MESNIKVADFVIDFFGSLGIGEIFEVYGAANGDLIDAFTRTNKTRYIATMHEQAAGFAVEGYSKIGNVPGVAIVTSGPGAQNLITPISNCYYDYVPAIFITGQVNSKFLRPNSALRQRGFQETDVVGIVRPITKYAKMVTNPKEIKYELGKAFHLATTGCPGPVLLDLPIDVQKAVVDADHLREFTTEINSDPSNVVLRDNKIDNYIDDLKNAKRPTILVGGGVRSAGALSELFAVGDQLGIPMFPTWNALDVVTSDYEYYGGRIGTYGGKGRNFAIQNSDLVLAIGSRISGRLFGSNAKAFLRGAKKYLVNIDAAVLNEEWQEVKFDENILCDAKEFLAMLRDKLCSVEIPDFSSWMAQTIRWRDTYDPVRPEYFEQKSPVNPYVFMRILSQKMKYNDILVGDCGGNIVITGHAFESKKGQRLITNNGNSPMGFSFCGAIGAFLAAQQGQNVVCTIGDGGFNMNVQELQTVKTYNLGFKTFIINNYCYGITRQFQRTKFEGRQEACGPSGYVAPNFLEICRAYDIPVATIEHNGEIAEKISEVLDHKGPIVCDVNCYDWDRYEPRNFGGAPIEDLYPYLPREEFLGNLLIEPWPGWEELEEPAQD